MRRVNLIPHMAGGTVVKKPARERPENDDGLWRELSLFFFGKCVDKSKVPIFLHPPSHPRECFDPARGNAFSMRPIYLMTPETIGERLRLDDEGLFLQTEGVQIGNAHVRSTKRRRRSAGKNLGEGKPFVRLKNEEVASADDTEMNLRAVRKRGGYLFEYGQVFPDIGNTEKGVQVKSARALVYVSVQ